MGIYRILKDQLDGHTTHGVAQKVMGRSLGEAFKSAVFAVFGLPDKQPTGKAKVYRLRSSQGAEDVPEVAAPVSAEAGRP